MQVGNPEIGSLTLSKPYGMFNVRANLQCRVNVLVGDRDLQTSMRFLRNLALVFVNVILLVLNNILKCVVKRVFTISKLTL